MTKKIKQIAIFHNFLDNIGGAERVGLTLARELNADIYTTNIDYNKIKKMGFDSINIISIGKVPKNAPFRQQKALYLFSKLNLGKKYDLYIIDGDWAISGANHNSPSIWYVHSPIREIWDLYEYTRKNSVPAPLRPIFDVWVHLNRRLTTKYANKVNQLICNSKNTQSRVKKYLNLNSIVINPPIETNQFKHKESKGYWLSVNRLITHKRVLMQLEAFSMMPEKKLIIVGSYENARHFKAYAKKVKLNIPTNVTLKSWVSQSELIKLYSKCTGFITTAKDEDFGMTVVEAMASGKPVVAPDEGGYTETIIGNKTGILLKDLSVPNLIKAICEIENNLTYNIDTYKKNCLERSKKYSTSRFISGIKKIINLTVDKK